MEWFSENHSPPHTRPHLQQEWDSDFGTASSSLMGLYVWEARIFSGWSMVEGLEGEPKWHVVQVIRLRFVFSLQKNRRNWDDTYEEMFILEKCVVFSEVGWFDFEWKRSNPFNLLGFSYVLRLVNPLRPSDSFKVYVTMEVPPQLVYYVPMATEAEEFWWRKCWIYI